jgi:hypothetical protein
MEPFGYLTGFLPLPYHTREERETYYNNEIELIEANLFSLDIVIHIFPTDIRREMELCCLGYRMREIDYCIRYRLIRAGG